MTAPTTGMKSGGKPVKPSHSACLKAQGIEEAVRSQRKRPRMIDERTGMIYISAANLNEYAQFLRESSNVSKERN